MKVCFVAVSRGTRRAQQRVVRGVRRMHQFLSDAAGAPHAFSQDSSHQNLRRAASSHSVRTVWLDARMHGDFCAYHLLHAGIAAETLRSVCGAARAAALKNGEFPGSGRKSSASGDVWSLLFTPHLLGNWWGQAAAFVAAASDLVRDSWESVWDGLEWLRVFVEAWLEVLLGPEAAEWLEGWFKTGATSWKGAKLLTVLRWCWVCFVALKLHFALS